MNSIWIARDKDGSLNSFASKPEIDDYELGTWFSDDGKLSSSLQNYWFPEIRFENSPIELVIKEKEDEQ